MIGLGLAVRLAFIRELTLTPLWWVNFSEGLDTLTHLRASQAILADAWLSDTGRTFYQSPLYAYVLGGTQRLLGPDPVWLAYTQAVWSALAVLVVTRLAARHAGPAAGFAAAVLASVCVQAIFYPLYFLPATLEMLCASLALSAVAAAVPAHSAGPWRWAGLAIGLAFLARPNIAAATAAMLVALILFARPPAGRVAVAGLGLAAGLALVLAPMLIRNLQVAGLPGLLPSSGRENFRIGNSEDSLVSGFSYPTGPPLPLFSGAMLRHQAAKLTAFFRGYEVPQNVNMYLVREESMVLSMPLLGLHHLVGLGVLGALAGRRGLAVKLLVVWVLAYAASVSAFFVVGRFRLPVVPALVLLGAVGLGELCKSWRAGRLGAALLFAVPALGVTLLAGQLPELPVRPNDYAIALEAGWPRHRPASLHALAARAARDYPAWADCRAWHAATLADLRDPAALREIEATLALEPENARALIALLAYHMEVTRDEAAIQAVRRRLDELGVHLPDRKVDGTATQRR